MGCEAEGLTPLAGEWVGSSGVIFHHSLPRLHFMVIVHSAIR